MPLGWGAVTEHARCRICATTVAVRVQSEIVRRFRAAVPQIGAMPDFAHAEATAGRALDVIDQLLAARDTVASGVGGIGFLREHEAVAPVAWSWWMLISDSARVVAEAAKNGNGFVVAPVMQNLMTHAVAMAWLVAGGDAAVQAVDAYSDNQLLKLITDAKRAGWDVEGDEVEAKVRAAVDECTAHPATEVVRLTNEIRNTADLMAAFGEQEGYLPYRHLSPTPTPHERRRSCISIPPGPTAGNCATSPGRVA